VTENEQNNDSEGTAETGVKKGPWDVNWVMSVLPHRYPLLLVDRVLEIEEEKRIVATKCYSVNEEFFQGHFPGHPVVPGVLLVEGMAQAGGILLLHNRPNRSNELQYFMSIERARFRRPVVPGDVVHYEVEVLRLRRNHCKLQCVARVDGEVAAEAICSSAMVPRESLGS